MITLESKEDKAQKNQKVVENNKIHSDVCVVTT